jgi:hypothetical protein
MGENAEQNNVNTALGHPYIYGMPPYTPLPTKAILVIIGYLTALNRARDDVEQSTGCVYAGFSWHG